jgi:cell division septation protein DedD
VETVAELVQLVDELQNEYGLDKPIWVNETNAAPNLDPWWPVERPQFPVDLDQQAWYIVQAYALGFGAGAESIGVYKLIDILLPEGGESFGILRPDYSQRPAFLAFRATINQLRDFVPPATIQELGDAFIVTFNWPDKVTRIIWSRRDRQVTLSVPALAGSATRVDYLGNEQTLNAEQGRYRVELEGARCRDACDIGGPPIFLVEKGVTLAEGELPRLSSRLGYATLTPAPEPTLTFTPWPTGTASPTPTATNTQTPTATNTPTPSPTPSATATATATQAPAEAPPATASPAATPVTLAAESGRSSAWLGLVGALFLVAGAGALLWLRSRA